MTWYALQDPQGIVYDAIAGSRKRATTYHVCVHERGGQDVAKIDHYFGTDEEKEKATRLLAAAPDLLEALKYAIKQFPELATVPGISAAIAKATGATS